MPDTDKINYWWSPDRQLFFIAINEDGTVVTVSLTPAEAKALENAVGGIYGPAA